MLELQLIPDADILVAYVLELFDEAIGLLLRHTVCFESPALHDFEDLEQALVLLNEENHSEYTYCTRKHFPGRLVV